MKRLTRIAAVLLALVLALPFTGCGKEDAQAVIELIDSAINMAADSEAALAEGSERSETYSSGKQESVAESSYADAGKGLTVTEDGTYIDKEHVALYIYTFDKLPSNYITKKEAQEAGWKSNKGNLNIVCPGMSIGGDYFGNREGLLPKKKGRSYYECDINYNPKEITDKPVYRGDERIIYSNDGLVFYTDDHYATFEQLY